MTISGITYPDIIDDLLEGLRHPSLIIIRGPAGVGKALFIATLVKDYIEKGRGKAYIINFMISRETSIKYARRHGIDLEKYVHEDKLNIRNIVSIPFSEEGLASLYTALTEAADYVRDGIIVLYPADLAFVGLTLREIVKVIGVIRSIMEDFGSKIVLSFTEHDDEESARVRGIFEAIADFVFRISAEIPEAGVPRRYLTIIKPIGRFMFASRTLELYTEHGTGYRLFSYGILPTYKAEIDLNDKIYTGIKVLDELVDGFIRGTIVAFLGTTGAGKTALLLTLAYKLAEAGERVLYISLEEPAEQLIQALRGLGYSYEDVRENLLIMNINPRAITLHSFFNILLRRIDMFKVSVIVIDGLHALAREFGDETFRVIKDIGYYAKSSKMTLFISELLGERGALPLPPISTIADALIRLVLERINHNYNRLICLEKYRMKSIEPTCKVFKIPLEPSDQPRTCRD